VRAASRFLLLCALCAALPAQAQLPQEDAPPPSEDSGYDSGETIEETPDDMPEFPPESRTIPPGPVAPAAPAEPAVQPPPEEAPKPANAIRLQGLNKVTARVSTLEAPLGTVMNFGNLEIIARRCWQSAPEDRPENAALLEVRETRPGEGPQTVFSGWMFSSSPGLSALEHPVYDITVLSCLHLDKLE
jgi:hypothetical protein